MQSLQINHISGEDDLDQAYQLRKTVFMDEQGVSEEEEFDGLDDQCEHLLARIGDRAVGTLRIRRIDGDIAKIERVVVLKNDRGRQVGAKLVKAALQRVRELGLRTVKLHAQTQATSFYAKLGFVAYGDIFDEDGIQHIAMKNNVT